ncbi:Peptidyl-tRNA hydrolase 2, mitochondrial, partial [Linum perenne]
KQKKEKSGGLSETFQPENFIPGLVIGFIIGLFLDLTIKPSKGSVARKNFMPGKTQQQSLDSSSGDKELKMVLVVRQDLKMGTGKIASQCAHASTGMYSELMQSDRSLLRRWEQCGQPKIVVTCKNQTEMDRLKEAADDIGLPTFVVADAGRTQVSAGSKTVMAVGPGMFSFSRVESLLLLCLYLILD